MTASVIEQVLARAQAALLGATPAGSNVFRNRTDALAPADFPALVFRRTPSAEEAFANGMQRTVGTFDLEHYVDVDVYGDAGWETAVDALHVAANAALLSDTPLSALCRGLRSTGTDTLGDGAERVIGRLVVRYQFQFLVRPGDLSRPFN